MIASPAWTLARMTTWSSRSRSPSCALACVRCCAATRPARNDSATRDLVLDLAAARVTRGGREVSLTRTEYLLLELFLRNPGRVLSHSQIFQAVWGYDFGLRSNNLWVYMSYLRAKLEAGGEPRILHTVRGLGYVLRDAP